MEEELRRPIHSFSYPVGGYDHFTSETKELVRQAGYEMAFSFTHEINEVSAIDRYAIRRIVPPEELALCAGIFAFPALFVQRRSALPTQVPS